MRPLRYQGRLPRSGLRLLDIFVKPTSACYRLVGVVERPLGPRRLIFQVQRSGMGAQVPGALGVALCQAQKPRLRRWCPVERGGGSCCWWRSPGAGESWRRDAPESGGGWSVFFYAGTGESTLLDGGSGWRYGAPSSVSSPEPAPGGSPFSSRGISSDLSLSRGHPGWGAWKTLACPE